MGFHSLGNILCVSAFVFLLCIKQKVCLPADLAEPKYAYACEGMQATLMCKEGEYIEIVDAKYGFFGNFCPGFAEEQKDVVCYSRAAKTKVQEKCDHRNFCIVKVDSTEFKDPCAKGIYKHLEMAYKCLK